MAASANWSSGSDHSGSERRWCLSRRSMWHTTSFGGRHVTAGTYRHEGTAWRTCNASCGRHATGHALAVVTDSTIVLRLRLLIGRHQDPIGLANMAALLGKPYLMFNVSSKPIGSNAHVFIVQPIPGSLFSFSSYFSFLIFRFLFLFQILFLLFCWLCFFNSFWKTLFPHYMNTSYPDVYEQCFSIIEHYIQQ